MIEDRQRAAREPWEDEPWVRDLDELVRPSFVTAPPADVQRTILAAVLLAAAQPTAAPVLTPLPVAQEASRPLPWVAYVLFAAVVVAYIAGVSWLQGLFGNVTWLSILAEQLLTVSQQAFGRPDTGAPMALIWQLFLQAPWVALLPVAWLLWDRDRTSAPTA